MADKTNNVVEYLKRLNDEKIAKQKRSKGKEKRITIILSEYDYRRLKYIAEHLSSQPSVFARELLLQSLVDSEKITGLSELSEEVDYFKEENGNVIEYHLLSKYGNYVNAVGEDDSTDE